VISNFSLRTQSFAEFRNWAELAALPSTGSAIVLTVDSSTWSMQVLQTICEQNWLILQFQGDHAMHFDHISC
jgi:hypothetical protein